MTSAPGITGKFRQSFYAQDRLNVGPSRLASTIDTKIRCLVCGSAGGSVYGYNLNW